MRLTLATLLSLSLLTSAAAGQTRAITIGKLTYVGTGSLTESGGTVIKGVSTYEFTLNTTAVTEAPITFANAILLVKGTREGAGLPDITTGVACGQNNGSTEPCDVLFLGGPGGSGFKLAPCASPTLTQTCVSIALQLVSTTGKNFSFVLADGEQFCAYGVNNTFVLAQPGKAALDPQCNAQGFCRGASAPIVLRAAPATSCTE